jgi:CxxC motif-containing protein (DUF1111 family)
MEEASKTTFQPGLSTCDSSSKEFQGGGNCVAGRAALAIFGDGLVEAVSDDTLKELADSEPSAIRGTVKLVTENFATDPHVGRFGWKDDHAVLRGFAGDAYLNEMGITNPDNQHEVSDCALNQTAYGLPLQTSSGNGFEDSIGADGRADIDRFTDFMRALAPPPTLPRNASARSGAKLFANMSCAGCHTTSMSTASNSAALFPPASGGTATSQTLSQTLASQPFHPYSDFLLHDMGPLGDGITSGVAGPTMMRTVPLWGVRGKSQFLHDGRAGDLSTAISLHDGQGKAAAQAFGALSPQQQQDVVNFLNTL